MKLLRNLLIVLVFLLIFVIPILYWKQNWLILHIPFGNFSSAGIIKDEGFIEPMGGEGGFGLISLPSCLTIDDLYKDKGSPRLEYTLVNKSINFLSYSYRPVKVWGKVEVKTIKRKMPECLWGDCIITITTKTMYVEKIEDDNRPLSTCQQEYLNRRAGIKPTAMPQPSLQVKPAPR